VRVTAFVNPAVDPAAVPPPGAEATSFHAGLRGYRPTPVHVLGALARELGVGSVTVKDESDRLGLPSFKALGASWAIERTVRERPDVHTLIAASAGNHGRAVAHIAATRGLRCRVFLPARAAAARRAAIATEGAEVIVLDGDYEDAVTAARNAALDPGTAEIADVGDTQPAAWVIDGYATLFTEADQQGEYDLIIVPVGVGSFAAAAARHAAHNHATVIGVEPDTAACLTASLRAGRPTRVPTPGTSMAGLDCAEVSPAAWPTLHAGIHGTVTVTDTQVHAAMRELAQTGLAIGESGAAPLAGLRNLLNNPTCDPLRDNLRLTTHTRVLLIATEGPTDADSYQRALAHTASDPLH
jgi:diaminopropionate ammonia-lyase